MSLINCPDCNNEVSDNAEICPHCGLNLLKYNKKEKKRNRKLNSSCVCDTIKTKLLEILLMKKTIIVFAIIIVGLSAIILLNVKWNFANTASFATLMLFVFYFCGRIMTIFFIKDTIKDTISIVESNKELEDYQIVDEYIQDDGDRDVVLTAVQGIKNIRIVKCHVDLATSDTIPDETVHSYRFLNIGHSLHIKIHLTEIFPRYYIEYLTNDFMRVKVDMSENLKSGVLSEFATQEHTSLSILYYLVR